MTAEVKVFSNFSPQMWMLQADQLKVPSKRTPSMHSGARLVHKGEHGHAQAKWPHRDSEILSHCWVLMV